MSKTQATTTSGENTSHPKPEGRPQLQSQAINSFSALCKQQNDRIRGNIEFCASISLDVFETIFRINVDSAKSTQDAFADGLGKLENVTASRDAQVIANEMQEAARQLLLDGVQRCRKICKVGQELQERAWDKTQAQLLKNLNATEE